MAAIRTRINGNAFWKARFESLVSKSGSTPRVHVAVFVEPYLQYIFNGTKTVESRFSVNRCAPFEQAAEGDIVLLKQSGGQLIGICQISHKWYYNMDPSKWKTIRDRFGGPLAITDASFWQRKRDACYASLFKISHVYRFEPLPFEKRDRRGWVILKETNRRQSYLFSS
ncbi:MAG: ASCH domain-containing protein [Opitutaceae bacterium]|nr:hypothetical protein [Cephaloticoccus sp.]MCP5530500.1 ASCH domain-containing protein [Opitutaceae bacterium]